jgi:hypothetical protein
MSFLKEAVDRLQGETPKWFKKLGNASIAAGTAGVAMLGMQTALSAITPAGSIAPHVPEIITALGSHLMVAGAIGKVVSAFACTNTPETKP